MTAKEKANVADLMHDGQTFWLVQQIYEFSLFGNAGLTTVLAGLTAYTVFVDDFRKRPIDWRTILKDVAALAGFFALGYLPLEASKRLLFHPLLFYPGPFAAKLTRFWYTSFLVGGQTPYVIRGLHQNHGDIIRIAPDEISINNADWIEKILGDTSAFEKGGDYLGLFHADNMQLQGIQDFDAHALRRKYWDRGFLDTALDEWQNFNVRHAKSLVTAMKKKASQGKAFDIGQYCSFYASDIGSELAYGQSDKQIESGKADFVSGLTFKALVIAAQKRWLQPVTRLVPGFNNLFKLTERRLGAGPKNDLFGAIIGEEAADLKNLTFSQQAAEARTILLAGSPTVGNAFAFAIQFLLEAKMWDRLAAEVKGVDLHDRKALADLSFLNAAINETLRLRPLVPSRTQRVVPNSGLILPDGKRVPRRTFVGIPFFTVQRDSRYFDPDPDSFRPDRWLKQDLEERFEVKAFFPFSWGPYNCVGKPLTLAQLRTGLAALAQNFKVKFSPHYNRDVYEKAIIDQFTFQMGELSVVVSKR